MSPQNLLATFCLLVVGVINVLPVLGVFSAARLGAAYGIDVTSPDLISIVAIALFSWSVTQAVWEL